MKMARYERAHWAILQMVDSKRLTRIATILHWTLPSCIAPCSVDLFGSVVEQGFLLDVDDDGGWRKSLYKRRSRLPDTLKQVKCHTMKLWANSKEADCWNDSGSNPKGDNDQIDSRQSYNLFVSQSQQQSEKSVHADCSHCQQRHSRQNKACCRKCDSYVATNISVFIHYSHQQGNVQRLYNKTKTEVCCCKVT